MNNSIEIYTDGGCHGNPGPGGWAFIIKLEEILHEESGFDPETTNNRMELQAVIKALETAKSRNFCSGEGLTVYTDSQYVQKGITQWIAGWERNGWKTAAKKPVKNKELWQTLRTLSIDCSPKWEWVRGHAGNTYNERCDELVQNVIKLKK